MAGTTGAGSFVYRHRPLDLPPRMKENLAGAHSAFLPDREVDGGDGATWFTLSGVGLLRLDRDLNAIDDIGGDAELAGANIHGGAILRRDSRMYLALASDSAERLWITDSTGHIIRTFESPYGPGGSPFKVCDAAYVDGLLFAANGYADNVCFTCDPFQGTASDSRAGVWQPLRFGGDGAQHGRFGTAHGVTRVPDTNVLMFADRRNSRLESYTPKGGYLGGLAMPPGALPCSVDYHGRLALVACLRGEGGSTPAPIYIFEDGNLVSELNLGRDLGLDGFTHVHNAVFRATGAADVNERPFVLAYAWNPGAFAVLEPAT
jgi:hypothetical protein